MRAQPARAWPVAVRGAGGLGVGLAVAAPSTALALAVGGLGLLLVQAALERQRATAAFEAELLAAIDRVVVSLASGSSLVRAIEEAADRGTLVGAELAALARRHEQGQPLQEALDEWAGSRPGSGAGLLAGALALASTTGGSRRQALDGVAATLRDRQALGREVRALGAQARASAAVLVATPLAFSVAVSLLDGRIGSFLLGSPLGWACVTGGLALDLAGGWWMHRLIRSVS